MENQNIKDKRVHSLDGIRGWAALSVVLFHLFYETFGAIHPLLRTRYLHFFMDGRLAVAIFFVLSGQALSIAYMKNKDGASIDRLALKRYPRLAIPVFFSCLCVFLLMKCHLVYNAEAGMILQRPDWLGEWLNFDATVPGFLYDSFYKVFAGTGLYNKFLWTMEYELYGSFLVFAALYLYKYLKFPFLWYAAAALALFFISPFLSCFFIGIIYSQWQTAGFFDYLKTNRVFFWASVVVLIAIIVVEMFSSGYSKLPVVMAAALVLMVQSNSMFESAMCSKLSRFLGFVSFPLYLVHFPIMVSLMSYVIVKANADGGVSMGEALAIGTGTLVLCLLAARAFVFVEMLTNHICGRLAMRAERIGMIKHRS